MPGERVILTKGETTAASGHAETRQSSLDPDYNFEGHVDFHGPLAGAGGCSRADGWRIRGHPGHRPERVSAVFSNQSLIQATHVVFYHREDLQGRGMGSVFFFFSPAATKDIVFLSVLIDVGTPRTIYPSQGARSDAEAGTHQFPEADPDGGRALPA